MKHSDNLMCAGKLLGILCLFLTLISCESTPRTEAQYLEWIANPTSGIKQEKLTQAFQLSVQYLPSNYQAWQTVAELTSLPPSQIDSIYLDYQSSRAFTFTIAPRAEKASGDVFYSDVYTETEFKQRVYDLNFSFGQYWTLQIGDRQLSPVLTHLENTYSLTDYRKVQLVFPTPDDTEVINSEVWDLRYDDEVFGTGVHHFVWKQGDVELAEHLATLLAKE